MARRDPPKGVLQRGLLVLRSFVAEDGALSLGEISDKTGLDKSTTHRLVQVLVAEGFVSQDPATRRYQLDTGVLELAGAMLKNARLPPRSHKVLLELRDRTGESAGLHVRSGSHRLCVDEVESASPLRMTSGVGSRYPLCAGAAGKVLVAFLDGDERSRILGAPEALGSWLGSADKLAAELDRVRLDGWSQSAGETTAGAVAVAAPIRDFTGRVVAAVNVAGPAERLPPGSTSAIAEAVRQASSDLSSQLGWSHSLVV